MVNSALNWGLFQNFFRREVEGRYFGTITGLAWALVHPVLLLLVYQFVFTTMFRAVDIVGTSFITFLAVALWPWLATQEAIQKATTSIPTYGGLIRKVAFPHEIVVYSSVAATLFIHFVGYVIVLIALRAMGKPLTLIGLVTAIPIWLVLGIAVAGIGLALSSLHVYVRDVEHVLSPVLMMLMYLTPILYPLTVVPSGLRRWVELNPFTWVAGRLRSALMDGNFAPQSSDLFALLVAIALFLGGRWMFLRLSPHFEDFV